MKNTLITLSISLFGLISYAQGPAITAWLQNTSETGSYYIAGNGDAIDNGILVNCQQVEYSTVYVYVTCTGVPAYPTGPFQDGNPSQAEDQSTIFKLTLNPEPETGENQTTTAGTIGIFINGVSLYDYRDGVAWNPNTEALCGGPGNPPCPGGMGTAQDWNRDAIPAENAGFDCSKGHPAMGDYHHHQNPSAFDLDLVELSDVCDIHAADGLYVINPNEHSPLIGYAYDGYPIYGAYGYANADGSGGITRIKSGYSLRNITERVTHADGSAVDQGPDVDNTYFLGYFREDYEFITNSSEEYLDEHNGRFCTTPEYPDGIYAYFCAVDENYNSVYPYAVGPSFYGVYTNASVNSIDENTTVYSGVNSIETTDLNNMSIGIYPNPVSDLLAVQIHGLNNEEIKAELLDLTGKLITTFTISKGSTVGYLDVQSIYSGKYLLKLESKGTFRTEEVVIQR
ncbi:MAG: YHYH protein [Flavobacteriales bacterium]